VWTVSRRYGTIDPRTQRPAICYGFSKDHRPDLKQLLFILTLEGETPVAGAVSACRRKRQ